MGRKDDDIHWGPNRGAEREPTRTCSNCSNGKVTELQTDGVDAKGRLKYKNVTVDCQTCGGTGTR
jgi:hypothetical protein